MKASEQQIGGNHYKEFAIQPTEFIAKNNIGFIEGNVIKYVCRHKSKNGRQDIEKAIHYLNLLLEYEYGGNLVEVKVNFESNPKENTWVDFRNLAEKWMAQNGYTL